jgi:hypothetical protein
MGCGVAACATNFGYRLVNTGPSAWSQDVDGGNTPYPLTGRKRIFLRVIVVNSATSFRWAEASARAGTGRYSACPKADGRAGGAKKDEFLR